MIIISQKQVAELLPMSECIGVMREALKTLARGDAVLPLRTVLRLPDQKSAFAVMPSYLGSPKAIAAKIITIFPGNEGTQWDPHQGAVLLFEAQHGSLLAVMDATEITGIRTAAVSGVATELLANPDAGDLAILGSGTQARHHLEAMLAVRTIRRIRAWSPTETRLKAFTEHSSKKLGVKVEPMASAKAAVEGADLICTTTSARDPVLMGDWLATGAHLNVVGASIPTAREVDARAMARSRLFVDRRESTLNEAGDFLLAKKEGAVGDDHIVGELGELLLGTKPGRRAKDEITLFKSLGIAIEDLASAHHIYTKASQLGVGTKVELGGTRHA